MPQSSGPVTYRQQYRRCGKPTCSHCAAGGPGHGPYWYASWWENGRKRSRYIGKKLPTDAGPSGALRVQTLGAFAVWRGQSAVHWSSRRATALFKCLLSAPAHRLTREQAVEMLWPEAAPSLAAANLRTTTHLLRQTIDASEAPSYLRTEGDTLALVPAGPATEESEWLDSTTFERVAETALAGQDPAACRSALDRYTGPYLPDDPYEIWTEPTRGHLERLQQTLLLHMATVCAAQGEVDEAKSCLRRLLAADGSHEEAAVMLMSLLAASGQGSKALRVYQDLATALEEDLDVTPGADVEVLRAQILSQRPAAGVHVAAQPPSQRTNLPAPLTSFVGREWERTEISERLEESRLVTLTGPGGCGKTRLALEVAAGLLDRYPDGIWLVEMAGLHDPSLLPQVVAATLGVEEQPNTPLTATLVDCLQQRDMLLVLDNCEHLIAACAVVAGALLMGCPALRILATSREALGTPGETRYWVPSLATPDPDRLDTAADIAGYEAIALFQARARAWRSDFVVGTDNAKTVARICASLDGLPLAIELAAARLSVLPVESIARRLDDRFRLLTHGPRTALPRQQTLQATVDWSYSLLAPSEQTLLRRLAVFAGGWTLEAAEAVCAGGDLRPSEMLDLLDGLVQKSLVLEEGVTEPRFRMLETIRQYARERLSESGEEDDALRRHAAYVMTLAERAAPRLTGGEQAAYVASLRLELDNVRSALRWAQHTGSSELGLRLAASLWRFWLACGQTPEGGRWLEGLFALDLQALPPVVLANALYAAGSLAHLQSDPIKARAHYTRCLEMRRELGDDAALAEVLNGLGVASIEEGDYDAAEGWYQESLTARLKIGDVEGTHAPMGNLGNIARYRGDFRRAMELYEKSLAIERAHGHVMAAVSTLDSMAQVALDQAAFERSEQLNRECLELARTHGLTSITALALNTQGAIALERGDFGRVEAPLQECLAICRSTGERVTYGTALINMADVALERGEPERAVALSEEALELLRETGHRRGQAFALASLSEATRVLGDHERSAATLEASLALWRAMRDALGIVGSLEMRARHAMGQGRDEEAAHLYGAADGLRDALGAPLPLRFHAGQERDLTALRLNLGPGILDSLWNEGRQAAPTYLPSLAALTG